jgi:putative endonuclease
LRGWLVYFEEHALVAQAIQCEGNIKHWPRQWKLELIERLNPEWRDLGDELHLL